MGPPEGPVDVKTLPHYLSVKLEGGVEGRGGREEWRGGRKEEGRREGKREEGKEGR